MRTELCSPGVILGLMALLAVTEAKVKFNVGHVGLLLLSQTAIAESAKEQESDVADERSFSQGPQEREARLAKNKRYNGGGCDLTRGQDCFFEIVEPGGLPQIPLEESTIAFVGQVLGTQPYLSEDRTHIYTETTFRVEELFKRPANFALPSDKALVVDRIGGAIRKRSGQLVRDGTRSGFIGKPRAGVRYVLFANSVHGGKDFLMMQGYELRDGKVFILTEDGSPGTALISNLPEEQAFLEAIRARAMKESRALSFAKTQNGRR